MYLLSCKVHIVGDNVRGEKLSYSLKVEDNH